MSTSCQRMTDATGLRNPVNLVARDAFEHGARRPRQPRYQRVVRPQLVHEEAGSGPGGAEADTRQHVRQVVDFEVEPAETDYRDNADPRGDAGTPNKRASIPRDEIEQGRVNRGRAGRVPAREGV